MPVTIAIQIAAPVAPEDKDLIAALSMLLFALGGGTVTPDAEEPEEVPVEPPDEALAASLRVPPICGKPHADGRICFGPPLHHGRHLFRHAAPGMN